MNVLRAFLRPFMFEVTGAGAGIALAHTTGLPVAPLDLGGIALGAAAWFVTQPHVRESALRRMAHRPRRTMTPEDYRRTRELERELGWEPSEPCMPVEVPAGREWVKVHPPADRPVTRPAGYLRNSVWSTSGTITSAGSAQLPRRPALSGSGSLSAKVTAGCECGDGDVVEICVPESAAPLAAYCRTCMRLTRQSAAIPDAVMHAAFRDFKGTVVAEHFAALARVGRETCIGFCPICAERSEP